MSGRTSFAAFWPQYLDAHRDRRTRAIHYLGTILGVCSFVVFLVTLDWRAINRDRTGWVERWQREMH